MRSFRRDPVNLGDARIAYLFLFSVSLVCAVIGMISADLRERLHESEMSGIRTALYECVDSLNAWTGADSDEARLEAASRFRGAVTLLPDGVELEPLLAMAEAMREGEDAADDVRTLSDALSVLTVTDLFDGETARRMIRDAVEGIGTVTVSAAESDSIGIPTADTSWYSCKEAERLASQLFGKDSGLIPVRSEDGTGWIAQNENLRIRFSAFDGAPESLVYIRLGAEPEEIFTDTELCERAGRFVGMRLELGSASESKLVSDTGRFVLISLRFGGDDWQAVLDRHGRVWSAVKVKR